MKKANWLLLCGLAGMLLPTSSVWAQNTPYIGFVYPAGGQQGTTFQVRLGGQRIDGVSDAVVTGNGVSAKLVEYRRQLSNQEVTLLREQLRELKKQSARGRTMKKAARDRVSSKAKTAAKEKNPVQEKLIARIEKRIKEWVNRPACAALASIANVEVTIASDAEPGPRELRLLTARGLTNPMVFYVGQVPEIARKPMLTCGLQVLGKEQFALRKRPTEEAEQRTTVPSTMNGQIASGEVNYYRFEARRGQNLVISVKARELIPFIADAVPGWFQPVVSVFDAEGNEVAFNDDFRFHPDPTLAFEVPKDGEYVLTITDAIYRGREDFVYRVTIGELPYVTSIFPLGGRVGEPVSIEIDGWNLEGAQLTMPPETTEPGIQWITAKKGPWVTNRLPFVRDTLPECLDQEANNDAKHAQKVKLPMIVNGRIDRPDDWDVFVVNARAGQKIVAEVSARQLESPLDSILKMTDATGNLLAINDDKEDPAADVNTHHADSYLTVKIPADGKYFIHIGDADRDGGPANAYRLRISKPRPDFALRVVPSSANFRAKGTVAMTVHAIRKDGFAGDIKLSLKDPPEGFSARGVTLKADKEFVRLNVRTTLAHISQPVSLAIEGAARIQDEQVVRQAVPAEDRMQAFLWRHLVPAQELTATVYNSSYKPAATRTPKPAAKEVAKKAVAAKAEPPKFNKRQVAGRLRQLKTLYEEWLITDAFYNLKVAECETVLE